MELLSEKSDLLNGINIALKAVPSKTTMSILECILINATDNQIKLTTNNMELDTEIIVGGAIETKGKIALDAKFLSETIRKLFGGGSPIVVESDEKFNTTITCENFTFHIQGEDGDEFSYPPYIERENHISLLQSTLEEATRQTVLSTSVNDNNKMVTDELFEMKSNELKIVSLDGHRMSIRKIILKGNYQDIKVIIPGKTLGEVSKILGGDNEREVFISLGENHILSESDNIVVVSRPVEGEYFRIDQMLSGDYETKVIVNKREFPDCIGRASTLIQENDKKPIIINILDCMTELKPNSSSGSMDAKALIRESGKDIVIEFNLKFLIDTLRVIGDEEIDLYMMNPRSPCLIKDVEEQYIYLILPVNFNVATV